MGHRTGLNHEVAAACSPLASPPLFPDWVGNTQKDPEQSAPPYQGVVEKIFDQLSDEIWVYPGPGKDTVLGTGLPHLAEWLALGW